MVANKALSVGRFARTSLRAAEARRYVPERPTIGRHLASYQ